MCAYPSSMSYTYTSKPRRGRKHLFQRHILQKSDQMNRTIIADIVIGSVWHIMLYQNLHYNYCSFLSVVSQPLRMPTKNFSIHKYVLNQEKFRTTETENKGERREVRGMKQQSRRRLPDRTLCNDGNVLSIPISSTMITTSHMWPLSI